MVLRVDLDLPNCSHIVLKEIPSHIGMHYMLEQSPSTWK